MRRRELVSADAGLMVDGVSVRDEFLTPSEIRALAQCAQLRRRRGGFAAARIGGERSLQRREEIRGDSICWITAPLMPAERGLLERLERLRLRLNAEAYLGLFDLELHHAWYPPGAGYARHVDQPHGRAQRRVSLVLYLNRIGRLLLVANCASSMQPAATGTSSRSAAGWCAFSRPAASMRCCLRSVTA